MSHVVVTLVWLLGSLVVSACGLPGGTTITTTLSMDGEPLNACEAAFREGADGRPETDDEFMLDIPIEACASVDEFTAESRAWPDALDDIDPLDAMRDGCMTGRLSATAICRELGLP